MADDCPGDVIAGGIGDLDVSHLHSYTEVRLNKKGKFFE
jgi:hypothetical protein